MPLGFYMLLVGEERRKAGKPRRGQLYGKCVREVPLKVRGLKLDLSRTLLATAAMASASCAHADYYASIGDQWGWYNTFRRKPGFVLLVGVVISCRCGVGVVSL